MNKAFQSDFLAARPSFTSGVARLADFGCSFDDYNVSPTVTVADSRAMLSDWLNVGYDIVDAMIQFEREHHESNR